MTFRFSPSLTALDDRLVPAAVGHPANDLLTESGYTLVPSTVAGQLVIAVDAIAVDPVSVAVDAPDADKLRDLDKRVMQLWKILQDINTYGNELGTLYDRREEYLAALASDPTNQYLIRQLDELNCLIERYEGAINDLLEAYGELGFEYFRRREEYDNTHPDRGDVLPPFFAPDLPRYFLPEGPVRDWAYPPPPPDTEPEFDPTKQWV